jgi:2-polyprenyl-3-methyl-5-hydroxy-6-metoxy-1,4-benzoquinol methylase
MPSFLNRSYQKELLDMPGIPFPAIERNMQELDYINQKLGGHAITIKGLEDVLQNHNSKNKQILVVEIGCGGGDNLRVIRNWAKAKGCDIKLLGIDINEECIQYARSRKENLGIEFVVSDYNDHVFKEQPAVIFSSLFCHHFSDNDLIKMLNWMKMHSTIGFFINDLHRHRLAYYSIMTLTKMFSKSYLVKNDAPLSVLRGFKKKEWESILTAAGITKYSLQWKWAFRWLLIVPNE